MRFVLLSTFMLYMTSGIMSSAVSVCVNITTYNAVWPIGSLSRSHTHSKSFAQTKSSVAVLDKKTLS